MTPTRPLTFVVGTGRTGSTALSQLLNHHPDVLSLNELFAAVGGERALPRGPLSGAQFWRLLAEPNAAFDEMIRLGAGLPEFLYPRSPGRFSAETGIPAICMMTLPHLVEDPDRLFDDLAAEIGSWPQRSAAEHYTALFAHLADQTGASVVVERSGHSVGWIPALREAFPTANFVHMHRNGPDCALSMSRHNGYRTAVLANEVLAHAKVTGFAELTDEHIRRLPDDLAALCTQGFVRGLTPARELPLARFGDLWSAMVAAGVQALGDLPDNRCLSLSYDELVRSPRESLTGLASFLGVEATASWLEAGSGLLTPARSGAAAALPADELAAVRRACAPGVHALSG
ncbi:sulfotransferase family protein [Amycolatopsis magusensis]|uniref:sulfotransferase family protein n=1 Tax=Amycolatopsis magusensis TaxID=882444 RepID=UPI003C2D333F